ncbi:class I SAM-dependent methyltransferase [Selenihalanaerobacter shriftii]|uniref:2-polyprenyl-3-methyl-5-hydroxy-6-metoxy-1,4-benzoquinol methylase n=1 Tax=Selenihalanaerobacter shriftii TaxID=142842 RepID=A0A1T4KDE9_9FIRM|nr:2-polyprenyl-3-methyl-5-hydroxy-6-metoxy-1,4-benzoquinol methylase [Selenihalanaerobacter shriftii]
MKLSPKLYHWFVRPTWLSNLYINNVIKRNFNIQNKSVLDFGCGIGSSCSMFSPNNYLGVDLDQNRIKYARHLYPQYNFHVLKEKDLNILSDVFDYILIVAVLHHIPSKKLSDVLQEFSRILKSNGSIIVIEPCFFINSHFNNYFMNFFDNGKHIKTMEGYFEIFRHHNYQINKIKKYKKLLFYNEILFSATLH